MSKEISNNVKILIVDIYNSLSNKFYLNELISSSSIYCDYKKLCKKILMKKSNN